MTEQYIRDWEYPTHFETLGGLRARIAKDLPIRAGMRILDVATGEGFFAKEIAKLFGDVKVVGIDISQSIVKKARRNIRRLNLQDVIEVVEMDSTSMRFDKEEFDMAVDFTGMEDIQITRGKKGIQQTLLELNRVLKPESYFCFAEMLSDRMETKPQKVELDLFAYICRGNNALSSKEYRTMLGKANFNLIEERSYYSRLKFTPQQAKREIKHVIKNVPKIFGIKTPSFKEVWDKFGREINENGMGCYSKVTLMIARKAQDIS
ncbi:MAG: class I SAM-dependent methyltransferase [Candidatus Bathyarchaeia archaeon]